MERGDFKNITKENIDFCKEIIENNGDCCLTNGDCNICPFAYENTEKDYCDTTEGTLNNAKEFIRKFEHLTEPKPKVVMPHSQKKDEEIEKFKIEKEKLEKEVTKLLEELELQRKENKRLKLAISLILGVDE